MSEKNGKKTFDLTILNQKFTLKTESDEKRVKAVADYVNKKMHEIVSSNKATATANVAILTALNIADDLFSLKERRRTQTSQWMEKVKGLIEQIET